MAKSEAAEKALDRAEDKAELAEDAGAPEADDRQIRQAALATMNEPQGFAEMSGGALANYDDEALFEQPEISIRGSRFPFLRMASGNSKEVADAEAHPGDWLLEGHNAAKTVIFMPTRYFMARQLQERDPNGPGKILCRADRVLTRRGYEQQLFGEGEPGGPCHLCPMSKWGERNPTTGKGTPPPCKAVHIFEGVSVTHEGRCEIRLKSTGERVAQEIAKWTMAPGMGNFLLKLGAEKKKNDAVQSTYFVPTALRIKATAEHQQTAREIFEREKANMGY